MKENLEELKKKSEAIDTLLDIMAKTGDPRFVFFKKERDFHNRMLEISTDINITDRIFKRFNNLIDQFQKFINETIEFHKISKNFKEENKND